MIAFKKEMDTSALTNILMALLASKMPNNKNNYDYGMMMSSYGGNMGGMSMDYGNMANMAMDYNMGGGGGGYSSGGGGYSGGGGKGSSGGNNDSYGHNGMSGRGGGYD